MKEGQISTEGALDAVFAQIEKGSAEQSIEFISNLVNAPAEASRMLGVLEKDAAEGNISKIASDTVANVVNAASTAATPLKMLGTAVYDFLRGDYGKIATDTAKNVANLTSAAADIYAVYKALSDAKISGMLRAGLSDKLVKIASPEKLDRIVDAMIKSPFFSKQKEKFGMNDEALSSYLKDLLKLHRELPEQSRHKLIENIANFLEGNSKIQVLVHNVLEVASENPGARSLAKKFITRIINHENSGKKPPTNLDKLSAGIAPYKALIQNINQPEILDSLLKFPEFRKTIGEVIAFAQSKEPNKNPDKVIEAAGAMLLKPEILIKILPAITKEAISTVPMLQRGPSYSEVANNYKKVPGLLEANKEELLKQGILTNKEYKELLESCKNLPLNAQLEGDLDKVTDLKQRIEIIKKAALLDGLGKAKLLLPALNNLAQNKEGLKDISKVLSENKGQTIEMFQAIVDSPVGKHLKLCGLTGEKLYGRLPELLTKEGIESVITFIEKPSALNACRIAKRTKSLTFIGACIKNAAKNILKRFASKERNERPRAASSPELSSYIPPINSSLISSRSSRSNSI